MGNQLNHLFDFDSGQSDAVSEATRKPEPFAVMVIDRDPQTWAVMTHAIDERQAVLLRAESLEQVHEHLGRGPVDLILIDPAQHPQWGQAFAQELSKQLYPTQLIVLSEGNSAEDAIAAMRLGACDFLNKPLRPLEAQKRLHTAIERGRRNRVQREQVDKLRGLCKELSVAHKDVTQQIDTLCSDLVTAYRDLASQVQRVVDANDFIQRIRMELDLPELLRHTLSYLVERLGPSNAVIFLPGIGDEFRVGGYINEDFSNEVADMLLQHLADVVAPRLFEADQPTHFKDNASLWDWIGDDAEYLADCHLIGFPAAHQGEVLAAVVLFRDHSQPFPPYAMDLANTVGCKLAECLARIIRVQQRHLTGLDTEDPMEL